MIDTEASAKIERLEAKLERAHIELTDKTYRLVMMKLENMNLKTRVESLETLIRKMRESDSAVRIFLDNP